MSTWFSPRLLSMSLAAAVCAALAAPVTAQAPKAQLPAAKPAAPPVPQLPKGGRMLPDVPIKMGGSTLNLKQYRGKSLVIGLISTTCSHCVIAMDTFKKLESQFGPSGFQVVVAVGDPVPIDSVHQFAARMKANFPVGYLDQPDFIKLAAIKPGVRPFVPVVMFVDRTGLVRAQYFGDDPSMKDTAAETIRQTAEQLMAADRRATAKAAPKQEKAAE